jgi:hypothetical protein
MPCIDAASRRTVESDVPLIALAYLRAAWLAAARSAKAAASVANHSWSGKMTVRWML